MSEARAAVVDAVRVAGETAQWQQVARAAAILNRAGVWAWREHGVRDDAFIATLEDALEQVDEHDRGRILAALQMEHFYAWDSARAAALGEESVAAARATGDRALLIEVLLVNVLARFGPGRARSRLERIEELRALPLRGELAVFAESFYARTLYECGRVAEADRAAARCAAAAAELRHTGVEIPMAWWFLARARDRDDPAAVEAALATLRRHEGAGVMVGAGLDVLYALRTRPDGAPVPAELIERSRALAAGMRAVVAFDVAECGDVETAVELLGDPAPAGASDYSVLAGDCLRVAVLARAGRLEELPAALARIAPYAGDVVTFGSVEHLGAVDYFLAVGHAALGDLDAARRYCSSARELLAGLDTRPWLRRTEALAGQLGSG